MAIYTHKVTLWNLDKGTLILTPHSAHSSHMTLPCTIHPLLLFVLFLQEDIQRCCPLPHCHTASRMCLGGSDTERARLLKASDRLQMPDFCLSSE